jgi:RNA polymerase sigma-B factor
VEHQGPASEALLKHSSDAQLAISAQAGNRSAREALIMRHRRLVPQIARSFRSAGFSFDDLQQAGTIGLILAVDRFDPARGVHFATYASTLIRGELQHLLRDHGWAVRVPRPLQELGRAAAGAETGLTQANGAPATIAEIAEELGEDTRRVAEALNARGAYRAVALSEDGEEEPDMAAVEALSLDDPGFEEAEHRMAIAAALPRLPVRQRRIVALRFWQDMKQEGIARELGISQMHVSRQLGAALQNLAEAMAR